MGRDVLHVTLRLNNGKVLEGVGRNLPATVERIYNLAFGKQHGKHAVILEEFRTGHARADEHRYEGEFHGGMADDAGVASPAQSFLVEARLVKATA